MRAVVLTAERPKLELAELPDPTPSAGEAIVRVTGCGICGSDLHTASAMAPQGTVLGHEIAGEVVAIASDVMNVKVGDTVAVRPFSGCGTCEWCAKGRQDHCLSFALVGMQRNGGFAEYTAAVANELFTLPGSVRAQDHALVEPFAVARRALRRAAIVPGEDVIVLGGGPIGLAVTHWARALGANRITLSDPVEERRELAIQLGADEAVDPSDIGAHNAPLVIEASGTAGVIDQAMQLAAIDGRVAVVGICLKNDAVFPWWGLSKELDVRFSLYYGREDFTDTIDGFASGALSPVGLVTETINLDQLPQRFAELVAYADAGKVILQP